MVFTSRVIPRSRLETRSSGASRRSAVMGVALVALIAAPVAAQTTASLTGRVTAQGRPIADAQIGVTDRETNQVRGTRTSATGDYTIVGLQPGTYEVRVQRVGFTPARTPRARYQVGQRGNYCGYPQCG